MNKKELLHREIDDLPESLIEETLDFVGFLKSRTKQQMETLIQSESSLRKDWLLPEEDEAWKNL